MSLNVAHKTRKNEKNDEGSLKYLDSLRCRYKLNSGVFNS